MRDHGTRANELTKSTNQPRSLFVLPPCYGPAARISASFFDFSAACAHVYIHAHTGTHGSRAGSVAPGGTAVSIGGLPGSGAGAAQTFVLPNPAFACARACACLCLCTLAYASCCAAAPAQRRWKRHQRRHGASVAQVLRTSAISFVAVVSWSAMNASSGSTSSSTAGAPHAAPDDDVNCIPAGR